MARVSVRLMVLVLLVLLGVPTLGLAAYRPIPRYTPPSPFIHYGGVPGDHLYRYGYRLWAPTLISVPSVGIIGAPLHGIVCSRGVIAELPVERQGLYLDGATVGHPGYRCLDFH